MPLLQSSLLCALSFTRGEYSLRTFLHFPYLDSTNKWTRKHAAQLSVEGFTCITAREQSAGYGRRGSPWISPPGNLYSTLFFYLADSDQARTPHILQLFALACIETLGEKGIFLQIKWPNDLLYKRKKCAGILAESFYLENRLAMALGLGFNVNTPVQGVDQPAISLREITGRTFDLEELLHEICDQFAGSLHLDSSTL